MNTCSACSLLQDLPHGCEYSLDELMRESVALIAKNEMTSCYFRPMVLAVTAHPAWCLLTVRSRLSAVLAWGLTWVMKRWRKVLTPASQHGSRGAQHDSAAAKIAGNYLSGQLIKMEALAMAFRRASPSPPAAW